MMKMVMITMTGIHIALASGRLALQGHGPIMLQTMRRTSTRTGVAAGLTTSSASTPSPPPGRLDGLYTSITLNTGRGGCAGDYEAVLDIYKSPTSNAVTVLHLPGGAYLQHVDDTIVDAGAKYVAAGYTVAVLYYRLPRSMEKSWLLCAEPADALSDVAAAMEALVANADLYHIDPASIAISGFSAGGHLAALYGTTCTAVGNRCPSAMVLHFPWLVTGANVFCGEIGKTWSKSMAIEPGSPQEACYPTAKVDANTPKTVIFHAENDQLVLTEWMVDFAAALTENGVPNKYYEVSGGGHFLGQFSRVAAISGGTLDASKGWPALVEQALELSAAPATTGAPSAPTPSTPAPSTPAPSSIGCSGDPCLDTSHCRSKWGSCGASAAYCNDESIWTADGCSNSETTLEPTEAPTTTTSATTTAAPTTTTRTTTTAAPTTTTSATTTAAPTTTTRATTTAAPTTTTSVTTATPQLTSTTTAATNDVPTTASPAATCAKRWAKCGGRTWTGPTCCEAGNYCYKKTAFYSQCKPNP